MMAWTTIKIKDETYKRLLKAVSIAQIRDERKYSMDEIINLILDAQPQIKVDVRKV
jgi:hypothetical protein